MWRLPLLFLLAGCPGGGDDTAGPTDVDGDGHAGDADCDEGDPEVFVGAGELCNGVDDDCDGVVDPDWATDAVTWYGDEDGDLYGDSLDLAEACTAPEGYVDNADDCDDALAAVNPGAPETCNEVDDDCDGVTDPANAEGAGQWHPDSDGDGYGNAESSATSCAAPPGFIEDGSDCDDDNAALNPAATERCNGLDDDCDGVTDPADAEGGATWYPDGDGDGYGDDAQPIEVCVPPDDYVAAADCDDVDATVHPLAPEVPGDGIDQDCYDGDLTCADAELRSDLGYDVASGSVAGGGDDVSPSCAAGGEDVSYHWAAPTDGTFTVRVHSDGNAVLVVSGAGGTCDGAETDCADDGGQGEDEERTLTLVAGEEIVLTVEPADGADLDYALTIDLADDEACSDGVDGGDGLVDCFDPGCGGDAACSTRLADADLGSSTGDALASGTTVGAGDDWPGSCGGDYAEDRGYAWLAPATGTYVYSLSGSAYDTVLTLWTPDGAVELACNNDDAKSTSTVEYTAREGELVILVVDGNNRDAGEYVLGIR